MTKRIGLILVVVLIQICASIQADEFDAPRILLFTKSAEFEHSVIKTGWLRKSSHVERILTPLIEEMGAQLESTKDGQCINENKLAETDVVIFYTSGDLTTAGNDGHPPMSQEGLDALLTWIRGGGGFIGFHSATDSFKSGGGPVTPYIEMLGGEFKTHGAQFKGTVRKVSPEHPAIASLPDRWTLQDEWYLFTHLNEAHMHVLALLEIGEERERQDIYNIPDYPIIWCRAYGEGRVLYNGLGHREDVWEHPTFKKLLREHIFWAQGRGESHAEANYQEVVPPQERALD
ncbi:MAG: ThuA domain-containing protein [Candidatus Hydrogenedens sp.]|jgi:type 1 glutamine amidotransferase|nr:ThuA domain-containing protein [Candidatus Hydrogenedens sp.]